MAFEDLITPLDSQFIELRELGAVAANWDPDLVRFFFVDYETGHDERNIGYIDAAAGTVFTAEDIAGKPLKTLSELCLQLPKMGAGRKAVVLIKPRPGADFYLKPDGVTTDNLELNGMMGYLHLLVRASDLTNSTEDKKTCGGIAGATGSGTGGTFEVAAGATTSSMTVVDNDGFPAQNVGAGLRIRFVSGNAANMAARYAGWKMTGGDTIVPAVDFAEAPEENDTFVLESPSVFCGLVRISGSGGGMATDASQGCIQLVGIASSGIYLQDAQSFRGCFLQTMDAVDDIDLHIHEMGNSTASFRTSYLDESFTEISVGAGFDMAGGGVVDNLASFTFEGSVQRLMEGSLLLTQVQSYLFKSCCISGLLKLTHCGTGASADVSRIGNLASPNVRPVFFGKTTAVGGQCLTFSYSSGAVYGANFAGAKPAVSAIKIEGIGNKLTFDDLAGAMVDVATEYVIDARESGQSDYVVGLNGTNTASAPTGDIIAGAVGPQVIAFEDLSDSERVDGSGNRWCGEGYFAVTRKTSGTWANIPLTTADPVSPATGDVWWNAAEDALKVREEGSTKTVGGGPVNIEPDDDVTWTGDHSFVGGTITVPTPTLDAQAASKEYVDDEITGLAGDNTTWTGAQTFQGVTIVPAPSADTHASTKKYVDDEITGLASDNHTWTGAHSFVGGTITVPTPTVDAQASTKLYVDGSIAAIPPLTQGNTVTGSVSGLKLMETVGSDPRTGGGLDRPVGSMVWTSATVAYLKVDTGDTHWKKVPFGVRTVLVANATTVDLSSLAGDTARAFQIEAHIIAKAATTPEITLEVNGAATNCENTQILGIEGSGVSLTTNNDRLRLGFANPTNIMSVRGSVFAPAGHVRNFSLRTENHDTSVKVLRIIFGLFKTTSGEITSLRFKSDAATGLGIGSTFAVFTPVGMI